MGYYTYYIRDFFLNAGEFPLSGEHYKELLRCCFQYSAYVSFLRVRPNHPFAGVLKKWEVRNVPQLDSSACDLGLRNVYFACEDLHRAMESWTDDLFSLYTMCEHQFPEDPVFFRSDGSVFFESTIHEGECSISPRSGEDVASVLAYGHWLYVGEKGVPEVPAKEHQLPLPGYTEIIDSPFYKELLMIREAPLEHIPTATIDSLYDFLTCYIPPEYRNRKYPFSGSANWPTWFFAFELYVLGDCDVATFTDLPVAFEKIGCGGERGFAKFFEFLQQYVEMTRQNEG